MPFIRYSDRPISIDEGSREVRLPQETGVSLTTREHEEAYKRVSMADLMTETNYLNPDVEVIAEINTPESFATFGEILNLGHGVVGTTHAETPETLVNRVIEQGLPPYLLTEIDLVVFPRHVEGERYVGEAVELFDVGTAGTNGPDGRSEPDGVIEKNGYEIGWNRVFERDPDGGWAFAYDHPNLGDDERALGHGVFDALAERTDRRVEEVEEEFHRKHRYVRYMRQAELTDLEELFGFLSDLRNDEAATVERIASE